MITFTNFCVCLVIIIIVAFVTLIAGEILSFLIDEDQVFSFFSAWIIAVICLAICITVMLYQGGKL